MTQSPKIQAIVSQFITDLSRALAEEGSAAITAALGGGGDIPTPLRGGKRGPGRPPKATRGKTRAKGQKRTASEIEELMGTVLGYVKKNPGVRVEQIGKDLGVPTKDLQLPISSLLASKALRKRGVKRATSYTAK